jgi:hypothetical protein
VGILTKGLFTFFTGGCLLLGLDYLIQWQLWVISEVSPTFLALVGLLSVNLLVLVKSVGLRICHQHTCKTPAP